MAKESSSTFPENGGRLATSRSHESLLAEREKTTTMSVDLSICGKVTVRPIHPSILSKQYCFQVVTAHETKFFSCRSTEDLNKWIISIKKSIQPTRDQQYRTDIGFSVWILEAKGLPNKLKKKYFCELLFDKVLYARTSSKAKTDILFWGENFTFDDLASVTKICFQIYEEEAKSKKEKRKLVGSAEVLVSSLEVGQEVEKWYPITLVGTKGTGNEGPSMRIKIKYQNVSILPLKYYKELLEYLQTNYMTVCETLEPVVSVKAKDDIAQVLLRILQACGIAKEFLISIVLAEVNTLEDENLVFRGNSFATKAMDIYMKMIGETYLQDTLGDFVRSIYNFEGDCEVDPTRTPSGSLESNRRNLSNFVEKAWNHILCSSHNFPSDLQETFYELRRKCSGQGKNISTKLISASIFLRFFCPAILSPSLFHLVQEFPDEKTSRVLTLIAKVVQNLANLTSFGGKEEYMAFMNDFVEREFNNMKQFLNLISSCPDVTVTQKDDCIDLGRELAVIFTLLTDQLNRLNQEGLEKVKPLQFILKSLQEVYHGSERRFVEEQFAPRRWASSSDLISDQEKERSSISLSTMSDTGDLRPSYSHAAQTPDPSITKTRARSPRFVLPTPDCSRVRVLNPDFGVDPRRFSTPITLYPSDLEFLDEQRTLRRNSYLNAMSGADDDIYQNGQRNGKKFKRQTAHISEVRSRSQSFGSGSAEFGNPTLRKDYRNENERELSNSFGNLNEGSEFNERESDTKLNRPSTPVVTDHSSSSSQSRLSSSRPSSPRPSSLAIMDTIVSHNDTQTSPQSPSPTSSPHFVRKRYSPRLLRVKTASFPVRYVTRSSSETSSSSSDSGWTARNTRIPDNGTSSLQNGQQINRSSPTHNALRIQRSRDSSPHSSSSDRLSARLEEELRDEENNGRPRTLTEYEFENQELRRELQETKRILSSTHEQLILQESSTHKLVASFKERIVECEDRMQRLREEKEQEIRDLMEKLLNKEAELLKTQKEAREKLEAKQKILEEHQNRIRGLETSNNRLLTSVQQIKNESRHRKNDMYNDIDCDTV